jgi:hypothetical protein
MPCSHLHRHFQTVISQLTLEDLQAINLKDYPAEVRQTINSSATLDFLRPALTISAVLYLSETLQCKCEIVAGHDERKQWEAAHASIPSSRSQFGVLFNPVLNAKSGHQGRQTKNWPLYFNSQQVLEDMDTYDSAVWFSKLHLFLSSFPETEIRIGSVVIQPEIWASPDAETEIIGLVGKPELARHVFEHVLK